MRAQITPLLGHRMGRWMAHECSVEFIQGYIGSEESNLIRGSSRLRPGKEEEVSDQKHCSFTLWLCLSCHTTFRIFLLGLSLADGCPDVTLQCTENAMGWGEAWSYFMDLPGCLGLYTWVVSEVGKWDFCKMLLSS